MTRIRAGNLGDFKQIAGKLKIYELRIHYGPGYRIYFGRKGNIMILLLCGGNKSTQEADIKKAISYWEEYNA